MLALQSTVNCLPEKTNKKSVLKSFGNLEKTVSTKNKDTSDRSCFDLKEGFEIGKKYKIKDSISSGSYGKVYTAIEAETGNEYAVKQQKFLPKEGISGSVLREIVSLKNLTHPCLVQLIDVQFDAQSCFLVFEEADLSLYDYLFRSDNYLPALDLVASYVHQLLRGLAYMHGKGFIHADVKSQNLLIDLRGNLKICDFGLTRCSLDPTDQIKGDRDVATLYYRSPELLLGQNYYDTSLDIWSAGCVFWELLTQRHAFPGNSEQDMIAKICTSFGAPNYPGVEKLPSYRWMITPNLIAIQPRFRQRLANYRPTLDENAIQLLRDLLCLDPKQRAIASSALKNVWFEEFSFLK